MSDQDRVPAGIDARVPSVARMYDYYLGGKDNFASDREAAEKVIEIGRQMGNDAGEIARANRAFLGRAVRRLAEAGVRQFVDLGAGLPTQDNVHQVARRHAPDARVVYVDNDPIVLIHARALLARDPDTLALAGDLRDPDAIMDDPQLRERIDVTRPYAVLMAAVLHFIPDDAEAAGIVQRIRDRLSPGSYLVVSHIYQGNAAEDVATAGRQVYTTTTSGGITGRGPDQLSGYFDGLDLLPPGVVPVAHWDPEKPPASPVDLDRPGILAGVGRVPDAR
ncbi:SAM-dependent methyltransferase [Nonomuraea cavernae]|uniref:SAM-dependent methyltransferase n=1 Tax=Nonomuraea cavernae TaxID=2045107 RepID=UPI0033EB0A79